MYLINLAKAGSTHCHQRSLSWGRVASTMSVELSLDRSQRSLDSSNVLFLLLKFVCYIILFVNKVLYNEAIKFKSIKSSD